MTPLSGCKLCHWQCWISVWGPRAIQSVKDGKPDGEIPFDRVACRCACVKNDKNSVQVYTKGSHPRVEDGIDGLREWIETNSEGVEWTPDSH